MNCISLPETEQSRLPGARNSGFTTKDTKGMQERQKKFFFIPFVFFVYFVVQTFKMRIYALQESRYSLIG
jgi:hypothetical protein